MNTSGFMVASSLVGLAVFAIAGQSAEAQTTLGARGGVSVSSASLDVSETFDKSNRTGFVGGVFLDVGGSSPLGFQVGAQYSQKGAELDFGDVIEEFDVGYLEIPAVVKLGLPLGVLKPSVFGGAALGFNTTCDAYVDDEDLCDEFSKIEFSGVFGADLAIYLSSVSLWVDGRYHVGLNDISGDLDFIDDLKNRAWTFQAGIGFSLGG
jgi:hypothetical protein